METPTAQSTTPSRTIQRFPARMNTTMPMMPRTVVSRMVMTRPSRSTSGPAKIRVSPSHVANTVKNSAATAAVCPWLFRTARVSQLFAEPSPSSTPSRTTPMSSSRQLSQPRSQCRSAAPRSRARRPVLTGLLLPGRACSPRGIPGATAKAVAAISTASPMNCAAGLMPRAAQAAPIPDPTAAPMDQAACMLGMRVRPAARSTAAPSTLISTSRVPIPVPVITKAIAISGTEPTMSARPMTDSAAAMSRIAPPTARRLPSRCSSGGRGEQPEDGSDGSPREQQPERGRADAEVRLDGGQPRAPGRDGDPAKPERGGDHPAPAGQLRAGR